MYLVMQRTDNHWQTGLPRTGPNRRSNYVFYIDDVSPFSERAINEFVEERKSHKVLIRRDGKIIIDG